MATEMENLPLKLEESAIQVKETLKLTMLIRKKFSVACLQK